jgi:hypothetical protein
MLNQLFEIVEKYLKSHKEWDHNHLRSIGEIEERNPWREDVWRHPSGWTVIKWENVVIPGYMSGPSPRYVWKLGNNKSKENWTLQLHLGIAPRKHEIPQS